MKSVLPALLASAVAAASAIAVVRADRGRLAEWVFGAACVVVVMSGPVLIAYLWGLRAQIDRIEAQLLRMDRVGDQQYSTLRSDLATLRPGWTLRLWRRLRGLPVVVLLALCGCAPDPVGGPKEIDGVEIDSPLAVTKCEQLAEKIMKADGPGQATRAAGVAQTCYLRLIEYRLRRLDSPPSCPCPAPTHGPQSDERSQPSPPPGKWGGGPDVGRVPPEAQPLVGPNGEHQ